MLLTCPCCASRFPLEAGFVDDDGKRLAALFADMDPTLGRAVLRYLRLFKPAKQSLRNARAIKIVQALMELVAAGTVCRDERGGVRRPATSAMWAQGIDQMLADTTKLTLPLANHHYLRAIVYGIADHADAAAERKHEAQLMQRHERDPQPVSEAPRFNRALHEALMRIRTDQELGLIKAPEAERRRAAAHIEFGPATS